MKAIKKEVNNPCEVIDIDCRYVCDVIKAVPELGYIERVPMENNILLLADEEGHIKGLPHNFFLSFPNSKHSKLSKKFDEIYKDRDYWSPIVTTW